RECGYISIIQLLQCVAQTCAVLQQKIDGPQKRPRTVIEFCKPNQTNGETTVFATIVRFRMGASDTHQLTMPSMVSCALGCLVRYSRIAGAGDESEELIGRRYFIIQ